MVEASADFVGTIEPQGADRLDEVRLSAWMSAHIENFALPLTQSKFKGGQSNPTYRIDSPSGSYVLRRQPFGKLLPSAHAVDREYRVQKALHATGFPVARQYGLCTDREIIGSSFYVMSMVEGHSVWDGAIPAATPSRRRAYYQAMVDTLAALHSVDIEQAGLADYGKSGNYFGRQIARWSKQYRLAETDNIPEVEQLIEFLPATIPPQTRTAIVHGDYRIDNIIFAGAAMDSSEDSDNSAPPHIVAVLDWELSTLGDPLADVTYFAMAWATDNEGRSGVQDIDRAALGIPELDECLARYCAATKRESIPDINWYLAYNFFRLTGIVQGIKKRILEGTASSPHAAAMAEKVEPLAKQAWHFAKQAGA